MTAYSDFPTVRNALAKLTKAGRVEVSLA